MSRATPKMRNLARLIREQEAKNSRASRTKGNANAFSAAERLRLHLTPLLGKGGYGALLSRALFKTVLQSGIGG